MKKRSILFACTLFSLISCANQHEVEQWTKPNASTQQLKHIKVLGYFENDALRRNYEDNMVKKLRIDGYQASNTYNDQVTLNDTPENIAKKLNKSPADGVLIASMNKQSTQLVRAPSSSIGIGAGSGHFGWGISVPIGQSQVETIETNLIQLKLLNQTNELIWSSTLKSNSSNLTGENLSLWSIESLRQSKK